MFDRDIVESSAYQLGSSTKLRGATEVAIWTLTGLRIHQLSSWILPTASCSVSIPVGIVGAGGDVCGAGVRQICMSVALAHVHRYNAPNGMLDYKFMLDGEISM